MYRPNKYFVGTNFCYLICLLYVFQGFFVNYDTNLRVLPSIVQVAGLPFLFLFYYGITKYRNTARVVTYLDISL